MPKIKEAFCVLAGLYRGAELGNTTPVPHFRLVTMAWTGCSLAVMAMAFLRPVPLNKYAQKPLKVSNWFLLQRVWEILLFSLGFHLASLNFCSQTMFLIRRAVSCQIHNSTTFFQITQNFKNIWAPIFQTSLNLQLPPIVNSPDLRISFINTVDVVIKMNN